MGLFGNNNDEEMKKVGENMQNLSEQIAELQKKLTAKTAEADGLRTQASQASGSAVALEDAQSEIAVLRQQIADMKTQAEASAPASKVLDSISKAGSAAPISESTRSAPAAPATGSLQAGSKAWVTRAGGLPLRLRSAPNLGGEILARLAPGTEMTLLDGPQQADGHGWWHVRTSHGEGWVAGEDLRTQPD